MGTLFEDLRLGVRMLFKYRELTGTAVLALSLGIGLTTIMFTIVYGSLLRGLPFEEAHQLVSMRNRVTTTAEPAPITPDDFLDWRERQTSFEELVAWYGKSINVSDSLGGPLARAGRYNGVYISPQMLEVLRVEPVIGRGFESYEFGRYTEPAVLIGYDMWQHRYHGNPQVIGQTIRADGEERILIGVLPPGFGFPLRQEIWLPLHLERDQSERGKGLPLEVLGRLLDHASTDQANADLRGISTQLAREYPATNANLTVTVEPYVAAYTEEKFSGYLYLMLGAVIGVLLIACSNVANLLLARVALRSRDMAVRTALGASRSRLVVQLLSETFVLALCGGTLGLILTKVGIDLYNRMMAEHLLSFWVDVRFDAQVFLFVLGITILASLLSGLWPALRASGTDANEVLKDLSCSSGRRLGRFSRGIVVAEFAISCGLLVATGLMIKSLINLKNFEPNFATENLLTAQVSLLKADYPTPAAQLCFFEELRERLEATPEVSSVAFSSTLPGNQSPRAPFKLAARSCCAKDTTAMTSWAVVSHGFFETFDVKPLKGRLFEPEDLAGSEPVALVNQSFAERYFPAESPLGRRFQRSSGEQDETWWTVIGVVPDMALEGMSQEDPAGVYLPLTQKPRTWMALAVRVRSDPMAHGPLVRQAVTSLDRHLPLFWIKPMSQVLKESSWYYSTFSTLFLIFGGAAFLLAAIGLYGVVSLAAHQRIQECGLRMALGAGSDDVQRLIVRSGIAQLGLGVLFGLVLSAALCNMLRTLLFQVEPWDLSVFSFVAAILVATGLLACWIPAQRTAQVDPMVALRDE